MSLRTGMFVFRLHQNEYSAIIAAQNLDRILGFSLCSGEAGALPQMCFIYCLSQPLIFAALRQFRSLRCLPGLGFILPASFRLSPCPPLNQIYIFVLTNVLLLATKIL